MSLLIGLDTTFTRMGSVLANRAVHLILIGWEASLLIWPDITFTRITIGLATTFSLNRPLSRFSLQVVFVRFSLFQRVSFGFCPFVDFFGIGATIRTRREIQCLRYV